MHSSQGIEPHRLLLRVSQTAFVVLCLELLSELARSCLSMYIRIWSGGGGDVMLHLETS